jgi:hypothetical protein
MRQLSRLHSLSAVLLAAGLSAPVLADEMSADERAQLNQLILAQWQASSGQSSPAVVADSAGTRLEWKVSPVIEFFKTAVTTAGNSQVNSPHANVDAHRSAFGFNLSVSDGQGRATQMQAALLASNARSVLSRYSSQITNVQLGRTGPNYQMMVGDVTANFSQLGSTLGLRGFFGSVKLARLTLSAHAGTVAESWEALSNRTPIDGQPARSAYLRDVVGSKVELALTDWITTFLTVQGFNDRESSLTASSFGPKAAQTQSVTAGAVLRAGNLNGTVEVGSSRFSEKEASAKRASGLLVDGTYTLSPAQLRFGYHDVRNGFVSLAAGAPPGVREGYLGAEWPVVPWLSWGPELRTSLATSPATLSVEPIRRRADALNNRLSFNLVQWVPGVSLSLQDMYSRQRETGRGERTQDQWTGQLGWSANGWNTSLTLGWGKVQSLANPQEDSRTRSFQVGLGRSHTFTRADNQPAGSVNVMLNLGQQHQRLIAAGSETSNGTFGLTVSGQLPNGLSINSQYSYGLTTQPFGGPDLKTHQGQLDATYTFSPEGNAKLYGRKSRRNVGQPNLDTTDTGYGLVITYLF